MQREKSPGGTRTGKRAAGGSAAVRKETQYLERGSRRNAGSNASAGLARSDDASFPCFATGDMGRAAVEFAMREKLNAPGIITPNAMIKQEEFRRNY